MLSNQDLKNIDEVVTKRVRTEIAPLKKDIKDIKNDLKTTINFFDNEHLSLRKRVTVIESRLSIGV